MCERVSELREAMASYASGFDPSLLHASDAARVVEHASAIEKMAATVKALAAARVAETELWKRDGDRSAAHQLARLSGTTPTQAGEVLETARRLKKLPQTAAAARRGDLSPAQASAIASAASADPGAEGRLLEHAKKVSLQETRDECARVRAAALPDAEARRKKIHAERYVRDYTDPEGAWNLKARGPAEVGADIMARLGPIVDRLFNAARAEGRREPREAYAFDALSELARSAGTDAPRRSAHKVIARVDLEALFRGHTSEGELCELLGYGPVACSAVEEMLARGGFLALLITKGVELLGVAHLGRRPTAHQETALEWLYPTCAAEGCSARARLERDHTIDWSKSHLTLLDWLDLLCSHHHDLKTYEGWSLVEGRGKRVFVPPIDPRHPQNAHGPPQAAA